MTTIHALPSRAPINMYALATIFTFIIFTIAIRGAWFGNPSADYDEQLYYLIGEQMLRGQLPFVDLWDRKPYGLFAIFAFAHAVGGPGPLPYQLLSGLFTIAGAGLTALLARTLVDRWTAAGAGLLYIILLTKYGVFSANSEAFFIPMMLAMAVLIRDTEHPHAESRALLAMLLGGLALQVKYTVMPLCLFFGMWALWGQYNRGITAARLVALAAAFGALGLLPTLLVAAAYAGAGHFDAFFYANFLSLFDRLPSSYGRLNPHHFKYLLPLAATALAGIYVAWRITPPRDKETYHFLVLGLLGSVGIVLLPSTIYIHYYAALVPFVVLVGLPLFDLKGVGRGIPLVLLAAAMLFSLALPEQYRQAAAERAAMERIAEKVRPLVDDKSRCLFVFDGPTSLYSITNSCLPTRFIYPDHLNNALERHALGVRQADEVARILSRNPPVIVTDTSVVTPQNPETNRLVNDAITENYREIARETMLARVIIVWALRE